MFSFNRVVSAKEGGVYVITPGAKGTFRLDLIYTHHNAAPQFMGTGYPTRRSAREAARKFIDSGLARQAVAAHYAGQVL